MDDLISRQAAIDEVSRFIGYIDEDMIGRIQIGLKRLPTIRKTQGIWKITYLPHEYMGCAPMAYYCSECNHITTFRTFYCPNCGADMRTSE